MLNMDIPRFKDTSADELAQLEMKYFYDMMDRNPNTFLRDDVSLRFPVRKDVLYTLANDIDKFPPKYSTIMLNQILDFSNRKGKLGNIHIPTVKSDRWDSEYTSRYVDCLENKYAPFIYERDGFYSVITSEDRSEPLSLIFGVLVTHLTLVNALFVGMVLTTYVGHK